MFDSYFAEVEVIKILVSSEAQKVKPFSFGGVGFTPQVFSVLASMIKDDKIHIEFDSKQSGRAEYDYGTNTLYLGFSSAATLSKKALVIHESVHAVYDAVSQKMSVADSESIAYIAQCQYARANNPNPEQRLQSPNAAKDKVFELAWNIAGKLLAGEKPTLDEKNALRDAVSQHPFYMANAAHDAGFNGVGN